MIGTNKNILTKHVTELGEERLGRHELVNKMKIIGAS